jgi:hypothetical protein
VECISRIASLAAVEYGSGVSLDRGPLRAPVDVCRASVVINSSTSDGISPNLMSCAAQQSGHAVELSPVGMGWPQLPTAQVRSDFTSNSCFSHARYLPELLSLYSNNTVR